MKRRGFTLVEMLVVIAIIAILAAILFPVFSAVRGSARKIRCCSNLRQVGLALSQYSGDYDSRYPKYRSDGVQGTVFWPEMLWPYHKSNDLLYCSDGVVFKTPTGSVRLITQGNYGCNQLLMPSAPITLSTVRAPSKTYMFFDSGGIELTPVYYTQPGALVSTRYVPGMGDATQTSNIFALPSQQIGDFRHGRHSGGVNVCFADGHVKFQPTSILLDEAAMPAPRKWGAWNPQND